MELITDMHRAGDFFGYIPLLQDRPYNENAEALGKLHISIILKTNFLSLLDSDKLVAKKFLNMITCGLEKLENRLLELAYQPVRQRVANELLMLDEKTGPEEMLKISRKNLSNRVGTSTESLNRIVIHFKDEGLIQISAKGNSILIRHSSRKQ